MICCTATLELAEDSYDLAVQTDESLTAAMGTAVEVTMITALLEDKSVTPSAETQIVTYDEGYGGLGTVTVEAIPSNYGLITWDGSTLTVS